MRSISSTRSPRPPHRRPPAWTLWRSGGRRTNATPAIPLQQTRSKQGETQSPLSDSNRRPLPYHGSALPAELRGRLQGFPGFSALPPRSGAARVQQNRSRPLLRASLAHACSARWARRNACRLGFALLTQPAIDDVGRQERAAGRGAAPRRPAWGPHLRDPRSRTSSSARACRRWCRTAWQSPAGPRRHGCAARSSRVVASTASRR